MIKEIFLPERLGKNRILAQRIIGITIQEDTVCAALAYATRSSTTLEQIHEEKFEKSKEENSHDTVVQALKKTINTFKNYDYIKIAIPASMVVFKEIEVPFVDLEKIRMILDYEIEPMLPFSIDEAILDFIITKTNKDQNSSQVLVAAVRTQDLQATLDLYTKAGIEPEHITIDLFSLYGLYEQIPEYKKIPQGTALVELGYQTTRISFIQTGQLRLSRYIARGIITIFELISKDTNLPLEEIIQNFQTNGMKPTGNDNYDKALQKHIFNFFNDIQFTLNSFSLKLNYYEGVTKVLFTGKATEMPGLIKFSSDLLQIPCELFDPEKMFSNNKIKKKIKMLPQHFSSYAVALGTAITSENQIDFDLRRKEFELVKFSIISKQLIASCSLLIIMFCVIGIKGYLQINALQATVTRIELQKCQELIKLFPPKERPAKPQLQALITKTDKFLKEKSELWAPFSQQRMKPLEMLLEVTTLLDKKKFTIEIEDLSINETEPGNPIVEVNGYFKSERGLGSHYEEFNELEKHLNSSTLLMLAEPASESPAAERGVRFSIKMKKKEE